MKTTTKDIPFILQMYNKECLLNPIHDLLLQRNKNIVYVESFITQFLEQNCKLEIGFISFLANKYTNLSHIELLLKHEYFHKSSLISNLIVCVNNDYFTTTIEHINFLIKYLKNDKNLQIYLLEQNEYLYNKKFFDKKLTTKFFLNSLLSVRVKIFMLSYHGLLNNEELLKLFNNDLIKIEMGIIETYNQLYISSDNKLNVCYNHIKLRNVNWLPYKIKI